MKLKDYIVLFIVICNILLVHGQEPVLQLAGSPADVSLDTIPAGLDSLSAIQADSSLAIPISGEGLDDQIEHGSVDTQWVDVAKNQIHLVGDAYVKYQENEIKAGYIIFDFKKKEALAQSVDGRNGESEMPTFITNGQEFKYEKLRFNFETQKGIVYEAISKQAEFFIHGAVTKFVSKANDSMIVDDVIYNKNSLITTCDHPNPHYGIRASKLKLIPDKLAVIGPSRLEIAGIPTPLFIPFAFMPVIQGQRSGIIFGGQQGFELSERLGFGFREVGYYWALNEYLDLRVTGDIYSRGSWGLRVGSNYAKRYKYRGNVQIGYSAQFTEVQGQLERNATKSFSFGLTHNQDSKAHPYITIGGNFNFTTNDFDRNNFNDAESQLENIINSNFRISHSLPEFDALSLNITLGHTQNTRTRSIDFTLPNVQFRMRQINPFKRQAATGKEKWYEKINVSYSSQFRNFVSTVDTLLFTQQTLDKLQTGMSHEADVGATFNVLKHFQFSPSINYDEFWVLKTLQREYNPRDEISVNPFTNEADTTRLITEDIFNTGFASYRDFNASANLSTNVFGTLLFSKGRLRGLRHTFKPSIGLSFRPNTRDFIQTVRDDEDDPTSFQEYTEFDGGIFSRPTIRDRQMAVTYSITNNFEGKWLSKKDTLEEEIKTFKIFNAININGSHNLVADSLKWSMVSINGSASLFKRISNLSFNGTFDPYIEEDNRRINTSVWSESKRPVRLERFSTTLTTRFTFKDLRELLSKKTKKKEKTIDEEFRDENLLLGEQENALRNQPFGSSIRDQFPEDGDINGDVDEDGLDRDGNDKKSELTFLEVFDNFSVSHAIEYRIQADDGEKISSISTNSLRFSGRIKLTDNWDVNLGNFSYDFVNKRFVYPSLALSRNLHCWNMQFSWQPERGTFNFLIAVNSSQLGGFLKYNYGRNQFDGIF